jgi:hypothetical protein
MSNMAGELDRPFSQAQANSHFVTGPKNSFSPGPGKVSGTGLVPGLSLPPEARSVFGIN